MNKQEEQHIKELLQKYQSGNLSKKEYHKLGQIFDRYSDTELYSLLKQEWDTFEDFPDLSEKKINDLYKKVIPRPSFFSSLRTYTQKYGLQIAASLLILFISTLSVSIYINNQKVRQIAQQHITIKSGKSGPSTVLLPDGSTVRLNSESMLTYRNDFGLNDRKVSLSGEGYFEVTRNEEKQFTVSTDYMDVTVLGTTFNIYAYQQKDFLEMSLVKGSVQVSTLRPPYKKITVQPNEKVIYNKKTDELTLEKTSNKLETAWLSKELVFKHEKLSYVFDCLERKYGVNFIFSDTSISDDLYTGVFDEKDITSILDILKLHYHFEYDIIDSKIYIQINKPS